MARRPFAGIENVEIFGMQKDPFLQPNGITRDLSQPMDRNIVTSIPADYIVDILGIEYFGSRKKGDFFKVMMEIAWGNGPNPVGSKACYMLSDRSEFFQRDVARFVCASMNAAPSAFTESDFEAMIGPQQPITRMFARGVRVSVDNVKGKQAPYKDFTRHDWTPVEVQRDANRKIINAFAPAVDNVAAAAEAARA